MENTMNRQELFQIPLPEKTQSYAPVSHQFITELLENRIQGTGLKITSESYNTASEGKQVIGLLDIAAESSDFGYRIAWQNSYDKSRPVIFVAGTNVLICSNGLILGDTKFVRRHTGTVAIEVEDRIAEAMEEIQALLKQSQSYAEQMKLITLDKTATAELCGRLLMEHDIITTTQLSIIRQEYREPTYPDLAGDTLWNLYNHTTHALKKTHPYHFLTAHQKLQQFVEAEFKLEA